MHSHGPTEGNQKRLIWAIVLTATFMLVEVAGGLLANSLALLADAGHMLTDSAALLLALLAIRVSQKPADDKRSYGYGRFQVVAAFVNGLALLVIAVWIVVEAVGRFQSPESVDGKLMLLVALAGLVINLVVFAILHGGAKQSINIRGALLHVLGDLLGSVGAAIAAVVILYTSYNAIDPILSVLVALLILRSAWKLTQDALHILLEGTPPDLDLEQLQLALVDQVEAVTSVHHVHAWCLTDSNVILTLHAKVAENADGDAALKAINAVLANDYQIHHTTVQIEREYCSHSSSSKAVECAPSLSPKLTGSCGAGH